MEEQKQPEAQVIEIPQDLILDLDDNMKTVMKDVIKRAFDDGKTPTRMCEFIKAKLFEKEEGKWNVIIGTDFSTIVVHKSRRYGLFKVGELNILIWQSGSTTL